MVQKVTSSILVSHPTSRNFAGIVQWLVYKFSKLGMRVRFSLPAPTKKEPREAHFLLHYFGNSKNATVPAAAPRIIVIIIVTIKPTLESFSGF